MGVLLSTIVDNHRAFTGPAWLTEKRTAAAERWHALGLPTTAEEHWRYSRIGDLDPDRYRPVEPKKPSKEATKSPHGPVPDSLSSLLDAVGPVAALAVVQDGRVTSLDTGDSGITVTEPGSDPWDLGAAGGQDDPFVALNTALAAAPLKIGVRRDARPSGAVVVIHWISGDGTAVFPRVLLDVGDNADVSVIEVVASADVDALAVPVTEIDVHSGAHARLTTLQLLGSRAWQVGYQASRVAKDATFTSATVALGGDYARSRVDSALDGPGATGNLVALWFGSGQQMPDLRTVQNHRAPRATSELNFKGVVANNSHSVYTGLIRVEKGAVGTNAMQTNRNLVLNDGAYADSVPNLEIEDNDVRCSHASAVGPINEDQRFYLESRGVPPESADRLIALGFLDDVIEKIPAAGVPRWLHGELARKLAEAEKIAAQGKAPAGHSQGASHAAGSAK